MIARWWIDGRPLGERASDASRVAQAMRLAAGVFTTTRITGGEPVRAELHVARLLDDAAQVGLPSVDASDALQHARDIAAHAAQADSRGAGVLRLMLAADEQGVPMLLASTSLAPRTDSGALTAVTIEGARRPAHVKSMSWAWSDHAGRIARDRGARLALLVEDGDVLEFADANVVVVTADGPLTPHADGRLLPGTTRATLLGTPQLRLREDTIQVETLEHAHELVLLSALRGAVPVTRIDGRIIGDGHVGPWAVRAQTVLHGVGLGPSWPEAVPRPDTGNEAP